MKIINSVMVSDKKNIKFSFLIALYNGEKLIGRALDSLLEQDISKDEYEIICLDDCSPDNSSEVVKEYQKKFSNIFLYKNEKNCRVATNVNKLVEMANGEYFWIVGQDDFIEPNCLSGIYNRLISGNLDVLVFNYRRVNSEEKLINEPHVFIDSGVTSGVNLIKKNFVTRKYSDYILGYEWRGIYKTVYWRSKGIKCVDGMNYEDSVIMMKALMFSDRTESIKDIYYNYRENVGSITYSDRFGKKGSILYEFAFLIGQEEENFYYEIKDIDKDIADELYQELYERYNNFGFHLIKTTFEQKKIFYKLIKENKDFVKSKNKWLNRESKILLRGNIGFAIAVVAGILYKIKKKCKKML